MSSHRHRILHVWGLEDGKYTQWIEDTCWCDDWSKAIVVFNIKGKDLQGGHVARTR